MDKIEKIKGWVARDDDGTLAIHYEKPRRVCYYKNEIVSDGTPWVWENEAGYGLLPVKIFPDLKWEDEPLEVELTIKRVSTLSEEPDKSLEEEYKDYVENDPVYSKLVNKNAGLGIVRHFAEWGAEHLRDTTKMIDKSLEEAAEEFAEGEWDGVAVDTDGNPLYAQDEIEYTFKAGAEWQASQMPMPEDIVLFNKGVAEGRRLERDDMMKDAVEAKTFYLPFGKWRVTALVGKDKIEEDDKVRIVVLKEEEE